MIPNNIVHRTGTRVGSLTQVPLSQAPRPQASGAGPLFTAGGVLPDLQSALKAVFGSNTSRVIKDMSHFKRDMQTSSKQLSGPFSEDLFLKALQFEGGPYDRRVQLSPNASEDTMHYFQEVAFYLEKVWTPAEQKDLLDAITSKNNMDFCRDTLIVTFVVVAVGLFSGLYSDLFPLSLFAPLLLIFGILLTHQSYEAHTLSCRQLWKELLGSRLIDKLWKASKSKDVFACRRLLEPIGRALFHQESGQSALGEGFWKYLRACLEAAWQEARLNARDAKDVAVCQVFVKAGVDVNAKGEHGCTPLELAVLQQNVVACRFLLAAGADMMACERAGGAPIWLKALRQESIELRRVFLEAAVDVHVKLVLAAYCGCMKDLIEALRLGADVEALKGSLGKAHKNIKNKMREFMAFIPLKPLHDEFSVALKPYLTPDLADLVFSYVHTPL